MSVVGRPSEWRRQSPTQIFRRGLRGSKGSSSSSATSDVRDAFTSQGLKAYLVYWRQEINSGFECKRFLCSHTGNWYYRSLRLLGLHWPLLRFEASVELIQSIDGRRRRTAVFIVKASAEEEACRKVCPSLPAYIVSVVRRFDTLLPWNCRDRRLRSSLLRQAL